jgi:CO/xanthine dehydrogenase Mo-binding subunit
MLNTDIANREFSRKTFLKGGGALIVGFSAAGAALGGEAQAADSPYASNGPYNHYSVDSWIRVHADNTASVMSGNMELGQGSSTALLQIAGEELDMSISQLRFVNPDTNLTPQARSTTSSSAIRSMGPALRAASAHARRALLDLAAAQLGVAAASLTVKDGIVSGGGKSVTYGALIGDKLLNVQMPASYSMTTATWSTNLATGGLQNGAAGTKPPSQYTLVGTRVPRIDIPARVDGSYVYVHQITVPGMLHGRVVWPRGQAAYGTGLKVESVDESSIKDIQGARIVRKGDFVGVVAEDEYAAIQGAARLKVKWADTPATLGGHGNMWATMRADAAAGKADTYSPSSPDFQHNVNPTQVDAALKNAAHVVTASYRYQFNGHMPIGPTCALADVKPDGALIFSNTQDAYSTRALVATAVGLPQNVVRVKYYGGSSSYGSAPYNEAALSAAVMSQLVGQPVRLQFMRWDEHGYDNYGPAVTVDIRGGIDANGRLVATDSNGFARGNGFSSTSVVHLQLGLPLAAQGREMTVDGWGMSGAQYTVPSRRIVTNALPNIGLGVRTGAMRSVLGPQTVFAFEQMIDELAYAAKMDPYEFRVKNVTTGPGRPGPWYDTDHWLGVLNAAAKAAKWQPRVAASSLSDATVVSGRGIASAPHAMSLSTVIADVEVNKKTGKIVVKHLYMAVDPGLAVNPGLIENQMVGGVVMATGRVLHEAVRFDKSRVTSLDWVTYPILRFGETPKVTAMVISRPEQRAGGAGEVPEAATTAAIANAFFDATGVRIRESPMTPARVRATLAAAEAGTYR